ncbi:MAG: Biopolymer transport protein ExbD/TolR [Myxococcaceae bacterium]|nr:Biopolymer transport protein ExbD/TolR [Myxococcaceae bacterium]
MKRHVASAKRLRAGRRTVTVQAVKDAQAEINVTPLIDVVLVLLIIFMVMTPLVERDLSVQLSTEKRTNEPSEVAPTQVLVAVDGAGALQINSQPVDRAEYVERLKKLLSGRAPEEQVVFVVASDDTSYAALVEAIDRAKQAGALMVGLATDTPNHTSTL